MSSKYLIATRADENHKEISDITHQNLKNYAEYCNADFKVIEDCQGIHHHYRILQFFDLFDEYDRIVSIDTDMLIMASCPNIFELVPEEKIGTIFEDKGTRQEDRRNRIKKIQSERDDIGWTEGYINTGFAVFSKYHRELFKNEGLYLDLGFDDVLLGYRIRKLGFEIHELPWNFNCMSMFLEDWSGKRKSDAYCIHYAGNGFWPMIDRIQEIRQDYLILSKYNLLR